MTSVSVFLPPSLPEAVVIKALSVRESTQTDWWRDVLAVYSLVWTLTQSDSAPQLTLLLVWGIVGWCPACVESGQALLNTTKVTRQQCSTVCFGLLLTNDLTSPSVHRWRRSRDWERVLGVAVGRDAGSSGAATVPLMSAQMIWDSSNSKTTKTKAKQTNKTGSSGSVVDTISVIILHECHSRLVDSWLFPIGRFRRGC